MWYFRKSSLESSKSQTAEEEERSTAVIERVLANHLTAVSLIAGVSLDLPSWISLPITFLSALGYLTSYLSPVECLLFKSSTPIYYQKLVYMAAYPCAFLLVAIIIWIFLRKLRRWSFSDLAATLVVIVFFLQPGILKTFYSSLR